MPEDYRHKKVWIVMKQSHPVLEKELLESVIDGSGSPFVSAE